MNPHQLGPQQGGSVGVAAAAARFLGAGGGVDLVVPPPAAGGASSAVSQEEKERTYACILQLAQPETREEALQELSKKRETLSDLAPLLWHSFGTMSILLQEIINTYPALDPAILSAGQSNRVCNALALLQCIASHQETRSYFLAAQIPLYLYPFLKTTHAARPFEYLRLTSLGVIGALVKNDEKEVIDFLLTTEVIPLCLQIMESGSELSKTVATFILQKILLDETGTGLQHVCETYERFSHVARILGNMVISLAKDPSARLLKHVIRCYLRLSDHIRAREALRQCLPDQLKDNTFSNCIKDDKATKLLLQQLQALLEATPASLATPTVPAGGGAPPQTPGVTSVAGVLPSLNN